MSESVKRLKDALGWARDMNFLAADIERCLWDLLNLEGWRTAEDVPVLEAAEMYRETGATFEIHHGILYSVGFEGSVA